MLRTTKELHVRIKAKNSDGKEAKIRENCVYLYWENMEDDKEKKAKCYDKGRTKEKKV